MKQYLLKVIPRSSKNEVIPIDAQTLKVKLTAPPVDGKANEALIKILADHFDLPKSSITLLSGTHSRHKRVEIP